MLQVSSFRAHSTMESEQSITRMLTDLKTGDEAAAQEIWNRFFHRVCGLAKKKLADNRERLADHEDVALSAMNALCIGAREGRFRQLENRDDLWQILAMITVRRAANVWRKQKSRGEGGESMLGVGGDVFGIDEILEGKEDAQLMDRLDEDCESLLSLLGRETASRGIATAKRLLQ